ncbi:MAG: DUF4173 domain-containing protein [Anaerolineae bacterium]|nr:DUF4173 domain-containing protein [Anaerolineae bacterium]MBT7076062.1 DUF4173 domain-containing protein [Anaerolineae bacterium]MBT7782660.1 DUF4173 domain-containing protein [Anaerolineae bacterium]
MLNSKRLWTTTIFLGISFDILFWDKTPGVSFPIFIALILLAGILILSDSGIRPNKRGLFLILPIGFFSTMTFLRAEPLTTFLNYSLTFIFLAFFALSYTGGRWFSYSLSDYIAGFFRLTGSALGSPLGFINETRKAKKESGLEKKTQSFMPVLRGLLIALPIVAIFASLLSSADVVFAQRMEDFVEVFRLENLPEYIFRAILILIIAYLLLGILLHAARKSEDKNLIGEEKAMLSPFLGFTESSIVLGSVLLLFATFVTIQFQYFFGGNANIHIEGYTYAEYARRGFSELITVAVFSLFLFLGLSAITRREQKTQRKIFSTLGIALVSLVLVMLLSAFYRLGLYEAIYGFSRLRTYPHVFMIWLGALLITVVVLEIFHKQRAFALAMTFAILGFAITLNILNVDAFIVKQNIARSAGGDDLDYAYLADLSDDAIPALAEALDKETLLTQNLLSISLACHWHQNESRLSSKDPLPWQSTHLSHSAASYSYARINQKLDGYIANNDDWNWKITAPDGTEYDCSDRFIWD